ncbi:hypothetical protein QZH41_010639 [Actinostola sp. cb2023]|nr:hypothetical protein QZH41_010639 [Actinostola sp. cb2023]
MGYLQGQKLDWP